MNELFHPEPYWCGTESAYAAYLAENKHFLSVNPAQPTAGYGDAALADAPRLFSTQGDIGVITISGSLVNSDSWINAYLSRTGYPEIRAALIHAASDPSIKAIALDVKSGGGMVAGLPDTAALIATIDSKVKPVYTYSDSMMASAAYWLGVSARSVSAGALAEIGSIGVLVVHQENSKMLAEAGITTTVIRSGKYKALGLSQEKLSALGQEVIQAQVDQMDSLFVAHVAKSRGATAEKVQKDMAQGRVFVGKDAVDIGLVDTITTFDAFISKIQAQIDKKAEGIDFGKSRPQYGANLDKGTEVKNALTDQQIAAMASGVVVAEAVAPTAPAVAAVITPPADTTTAPVVEAPAAETAPAAEAAKPDAVVSLLQSQLAAAQASVLSLSIEVQGLKASLESAGKQAEIMRPVVRAAVGNLRVALGGVAAGVETMTDENLLAEHANLAAQFTTKFKAGGVAAVSSNASAEHESTPAGDDPRKQARLAATGNKK